MKTTKRRIELRIELAPSASAGLRTISETTGIRPHVIANRVLEWVMTQDPKIRERILQSESAESDADLSAEILRQIAK